MGNFYLIEKDILDDESSSDDSYGEWYGSTSKTVFHIGKNTYGWKFCWNMRIFKVWEKYADPRWNLMKSFYEQCSSDNMHYYDTFVRPQPITDITEDDIWELIQHPDYIIEDEYGTSITIDELKKIVKDKEDKHDHFSYSKQYHNCSWSFNQM